MPCTYSPCPELVQVISYNRSMAKSWSEMTPAERMADRIAKNREIDRRVNEKVLSGEIGRNGVSKRPVRSAAAARGASANTLDKFQEIKRTEGLDAAAEYVRAARKA